MRIVNFVINIRAMEMVITNCWVIRNSHLMNAFTGIFYLFAYMKYDDIATGYNFFPAFRLDGTMYGTIFIFFIFISQSFIPPP